MSQVYDIGEDGSRWFVTGISLVADARVAVIKHLEEQLSPTLSGWGGADSFAHEVHEAVHAEAIRYHWAAVDRATELIHSDGPFSGTDADIIGTGWAIGFTMPKWKEK